MHLLSPQERREIRRLYVDERLSTVAVAKRVGRSQAAVHRFLHRAGLSRTASEARAVALEREGYPERVDQAVRLVAAGRLSIKAAERTFHVDDRSMRRRLAERGQSSHYKPGQSPRRTDDARRALVMTAGRMQQDGKSYAEIGEAIGRKTSAVYYYLRDYYRIIESEHVFRTRDRLAYRHARVRTMVAAGSPLREIATELGVSVATIDRDLRLMRQAGTIEG